MEVVMKFELIETKKHPSSSFSHEKYHIVNVLYSREFSVFLSISLYFGTLQKLYLVVKQLQIKWIFLETMYSKILYIWTSNLSIDSLWI